MGINSEIHSIREARKLLNILLEEDRMAEIDKDIRSKKIAFLRANIESFDLAKRNITKPNPFTIYTKPGFSISSDRGIFYYSKSASWQERIIDYFKFRGTRLSVKQIAEEFIKFEPKIDLPKLKSRLSSVIFIMHKRGVLNKVKLDSDANGHFYTIPG